MADRPTDQVTDRMPVLSHEAKSDGDRLARSRIGLTYLWRHGHLPDLAAPKRFTELVQVRKLRDRDPRMPVLADKVQVKAIVAERLGREWVVPLLWSGPVLPRVSRWTDRVVVKARHGCKQNAFVGGGLSDWKTARRASARWMRRRYGWWLDEWLYARIPRGLLVEPFVGCGADLPLDYKIFVFGGRATHVQVHVDRARRHRWIVHDLDWRPITGHALAVPRPSGLAAMIAAAEMLGAEFDFVRVDFYQPGRQPLFGEMTFYPGSGLEPFDPPELNGKMGRLWLDAIGHLHGDDSRGRSVSRLERSPAMPA